MSAKKKLIPAVGFAKSKDIEQITVVDTDVEAIKDVIREPIQDADETNALELVQDTNDNTNHESVQVNIMNSNNGSILSDEDSSTLSMSLCSTLNSELNSLLPTINDNIQDNSQSNDQVNIKDSVGQKVYSEASKNVENSVIDCVQKTNQVPTENSLQDINQNNEMVSEINILQDMVVDNVQVDKLNSELIKSQSSTLSSTLESNNLPTQDIDLSIIKDSIKDTTVTTEQPISKLTYQIPSKSEPFSKRLVANVTPSQKLFVQEMSKKFENESAFVRFMISRFMEDIDFKENE